VYFLGWWGFGAGMLVFFITAATNRTVTDTHYLYPLIPFSARDMKKLLFRHKKSDFRDAEEKTDTGVKRDG
jgi:stage V sporulation protein AF